MSWFWVGVGLSIFGAVLYTAAFVATYTTLLVTAPVAIAVIGLGGGALALAGVAIAASNYSSEQEKKENKRKEAAEYNKKGEEAMKRNDFDKARDHFENAYRTTDSDDGNEKNYKTNIERAKAAKANQEGKSLIDKNQLLEAVEKFNEAINLLRQYSSQSLVSKEIDIYKNNLADVCTRIGEKFFADQNYIEAKNYFLKAKDASTRSNSRFNEFERNIKMAEDAQNNKESERFNKEGLEALKRRDFRTALDKFRQAHSKATSDYINKEKFDKNRKQAEAELYNEEGLNFFNRGEFGKAERKFQDAINVAPEEFKQLYYNNLNKAKAEVLYVEAASLRRQERYQEAILKFNEAINILPKGEINRKNEMKDTLADTHNDYGEQLYDESDFREASKQFKLAINNAPPTSTKLATYKKNYNTSEWEVLIGENKDLRKKITAITGNTVPERKLKMQYFMDALDRINLAIEIIPEKYMGRLSELKKLKLSTHEEQGDLLMTLTDYSNAKAQFEESFELIDEIPEQEKSSFKLRIDNKITNAQVKFFDTEYKSITDEVDQQSDEVALEEMIKLLDSFKATADRNLSQEEKEKLHNKLEKLIKGMLARRSFSQAVKAAEIGKRYFPNKSELYDEILKETLKQDNNPEYILKRFENLLDGKIVQVGQQLKALG